jgi:hypothetical protein
LRSLSKSSWVIFTFTWTTRFMRSCMKDFHLTGNVTLSILGTHHCLMTGPENQTSMRFEAKQAAGEPQAGGASEVDRDDDYLGRGTSATRSVSRSLQDDPWLSTRLRTPHWRFFLFHDRSSGGGIPWTASPENSLRRLLF